MRARALTTTICTVLAIVAVCAPADAATKRQAAAAGGATPTTELTTSSADGAVKDLRAAVGGAVFGVDPAQTPSLPTARIIDGKAYPPAGAPAAVKRAIWAANAIVGRPYKWGGGHARVEDSGYDCSGTVSYALIAAKLLESPLDSGSFMRWGERGEGDWITVYTNPGHAFVVIAGLRLDTSAAGDPTGAKGPRWRPALRDTDGFRARHPEGL